MKKAISDRVCPVCGQDVSSDIIQKLRNHISESTNEFAGLTEKERQRLSDLNLQLSTIRDLSSDTENMKTKIAMLEERKDELELDIGMYRQTIEELRENISRYGEKCKGSRRVEYFS